MKVVCPYVHVYSVQLASHMGAGLRCLVCLVLEMIAETLEEYYTCSIAFLWSTKPRTLSFLACIGRRQAPALCALSSLALGLYCVALGPGKRRRFLCLPPLPSEYLLIVMAILRAGICCVPVFLWP